MMTITPLKFSDFSIKPEYKASKSINIFVVNKGSLVVDVAMEKRKIGAGKTFFVNSKVIFSSWTEQKNINGYKITIPLKSWQKWASKEYDFMLIPSGPLIREIISYPMMNEDYIHLATPLIIKVLDNQMRERCFPKGTSFKPLSFLLTPGVDPRIIKASKIILAHYNDSDFKMPALAKASGVSPRNMQRLFLSDLGITPLEALKRVRIENALYLIAHSKKSLSEIGLEVGYHSHSQFVKAFKSLMGMSPSGMKS
jgi:AraC-like DNA-binding protein